jgi:hypothetical protein
MKIAAFVLGGWLFRIGAAFALAQDDVWEPFLDGDEW